MRAKIVNENESFSFEEREKMDTYDLLEKLESLYKIQIKAEHNEYGDSEDILRFVKDDIKQWVEYIYIMYPKQKAYIMTKAAYMSAATGKKKY